MSKKGKQPSTEESSWSLESKLEPGMLRFMAHVIENGLNVGLRTEEDFIRHFPPIDIMLGLAQRPDLRAKILVATTGIRSTIASKKSAESAGMDLQIALDEHETDAALIISLFHADDRVRYLDQARLWSYIIEPEFWKFGASDKEKFEGAKAHVAFILDRAIEDRMLTHREVVEGIGVAEIVKHLPLSGLQALIEEALSNSHVGKPFTELDMMNAVPSRELVEHLPLPIIWDSVIGPNVAQRNSLLTAKNSNADAGTGTRNDGAEELIGYSGGSNAYGTESLGSEKPSLRSDVLSGR